MRRYEFRVSRYAKIWPSRHIHAILAKHNPDCASWVTVSAGQPLGNLRTDLDVISASCNSRVP